MGQDARTRLVTTEIQKLDTELYAERNDSGVILIMRNHKVWDCFEYQGIAYGYTRNAPHYIMALTDTWSLNGRAVDWGLIPIRFRLQEIDSWNRGRVVDTLIESYEAAEVSRKRSRMNSHEAFLKDKRSVFKKIGDEFNLSSMDIPDVRQKEDLKYGNC